MLNPSSPLALLMAAVIRPGRVEWIGIRPGRRLAMHSLPLVKLSADEGLVGDRYDGKSGNRHVTLIGSADLLAVAEFLDQPVTPDQLRRNIVVSGINLLALKDKRFKLGTATLEMTGECHPCSRMEAVFGTGGYNAVRGHGGITARVITSGEVRVSDLLEVIRT